VLEADVKVFWAWQADIPGKIARHFVREALEEAIEQLRQPRDIEEPPEESRRYDLHLDHDTKGLKGSPEVAHEIFKKIAASSVVVADVTPVGRAQSDTSDAKPLMNPNVAIELGYAFGKLGTDCFLPVLNRTFGDVKSLPFDIAHRRHPIEFNLAANATKEQIAHEKKSLVGQFLNALAPYVGNLETSKAVPSFLETASTITRAFFFNDGEVLASSNNDPRRTGPTNFTMPFRNVLYLRVIPTTPCQDRWP